MHVQVDVSALRATASAERCWLVELLGLRVGWGRYIDGGREEERIGKCWLWRQGLIPTGVLWGGDKIDGMLYLK